MFILLLLFVFSIIYLILKLPDMEQENKKIEKTQRAEEFKKKIKKIKQQKK